jgi:hypothetical protein
MNTYKAKSLKELDLIIKEHEKLGECVFVKDISLDSEGYYSVTMC